MAPEQRERIERQCDTIAGLLSVEPERIVFDSRGVSLAPDQADALIALARRGAVAERLRAALELAQDYHEDGAVNTAYVRLKDAVVAFLGAR